MADLVDSIDSGKIDGEDFLDEYHIKLTEDDLSYVFTQAKYKFSDNTKQNANNRAIKLTLGYKFSF